jgi:hypothetical protein
MEPTSTLTPNPRPAALRPPAAIQEQLGALVEAKHGGRDAAIVSWIGRVGAASVDQVRAKFGVRRTVGYRRTSALIAAGFLRRARLLHDEPALLAATAAGLRYVGLPLQVARLSAAAVPHWLACADVWLRLEERHGAERVVGVRELVYAERVEGGRIASARIGTLPNGAPRLHRPDLVVVGGERPVAVEVELAAKSPQRLQAILAGWRRESGVESVVYVCGSAATRRAVERAVTRARAERRIEITSIQEV